MQATSGFHHKIIKACAELKVEYLTLYAFSTENWKRPQTEVQGLMELLIEYLTREMDRLRREGIRVLVIGHPEELPAEAREKVRDAVTSTADNRGLTVVLALNYGGRREIADASRRLAAEVAAGKRDPESVDEVAIGTHLDTAGLPDPDLLIRPSGELRISNFLLWQLAYTEFWFTDVYWPDFDRGHLLAAIADFGRRKRRFGGLFADEEAT